MGFDTELNPFFGLNLLVFGLVSIIAGGQGNNFGIFLGALMLASSQHVVAYYIDSLWMNAMAFVFLIIFLAIRPFGFSGVVIKKVRI